MATSLRSEPSARLEARGHLATLEVKMELATLHPAQESRARFMKFEGAVERIEIAARSAPAAVSNPRDVYLALGVYASVPGACLML
jgi:hypothetical protein